jgi:sterol desaturase/sphingolipid hydroxylase (fatty acid hydroxylase superfamily)
MPDMPAFPAVTTLAAPAFVLAVAIEWWAVATGRAGGRYETKDAITSMAMGLGNVVVNTLTGAAALWLMLLAWPYRLFEMPVTWWSFIAVFGLYDLVYYWKHRFAHRIRWFWMEHVTHHSSTHYNLTTALRQPWFGPFTGLIILGWPIVLLGFHPAYVFFASGLNLLYQFWIHTEAIGRMPRWFEAVMNTPSHHRVHHATNPRYLDRNYAGVFIVWDRMFGTFQAERDDEPCNYGIVKPLHSHNPLVVAYHELAALVRDCWSDGLRPWRWAGRMVNPPGWKPDGAHDRSEDIRAAWIAAQAGFPTESPGPEPGVPAE